MVQEPALTLIVEDGGKVLFNAMDIADSTRLLGGAYEFMGVSYRAEEREERLPQMQALARALQNGLVAQRDRAHPRDPRVAAGRAPGRRRRRALRRDHRPLPRLALPRGGGDRRGGLRAGGERARGGRRAEARAWIWTRSSTPRSCRLERARRGTQQAPPADVPAPRDAPGRAGGAGAGPRMRYGDGRAGDRRGVARGGRGAGGQPDRAVGIGQEHRAPGDQPGCTRPRRGRWSSSSTAGRWASCSRTTRCCPGARRGRTWRWG